MRCRCTKSNKTEEEKFEYNVKFVKNLIKRKPEMCLRNFETFRNTGRNGESLEHLGIHDIDDLQRYINSQEDRLNILWIKTYV